MDYWIYFVLSLSYKFRIILCVYVVLFIVLCILWAFLQDPGFLFILEESQPLSVWCFLSNILFFSIFSLSVISLCIWNIFLSSLSLCVMFVWCFLNSLFSLTGSFHLCLVYYFDYLWSLKFQHWLISKIQNGFLLWFYWSNTFSYLPAFVLLKPLLTLWM